MFIRKTIGKDPRSGSTYFYHELVESYRTSKGSKHRILFNLGKLDLDSKELAILARRIKERLHGRHFPFSLSEEMRSWHAALLRVFQGAVWKQFDLKLKSSKENGKPWSREGVTQDVFGRRSFKVAAVTGNRVSLMPTEAAVVPVHQFVDERTPAGYLQLFTPSREIICGFLSIPAHRDARSSSCVS
ncbi:MAG: hypothetical protein WHS46_10165 [Desulfosoma sp.]